MRHARALQPIGFLVAVGVLALSGVGDRSAIGTAVELVRLGALVLASWFALVSSVAVLARGTALGALAQRALPLALAAAASAAPAGAQDGGGTATMSVLDEEPAATPTTAPPPAPVPLPVPAPEADADAEVAAVAEEWVVGAGDSFWSIAEATLGEVLGRAPGDAEVDPYWRRLVEANGDRIVSGDPDVIFPGQRLALPPP
jgi:hypothetical protein